MHNTTLHGASTTRFPSCSLLLPVPLLPGPSSSCSRSPMPFHAPLPRLYFVVFMVTLVRSTSFTSDSKPCAFLSSFLTLFFSLLISSHFCRQWLISGLHISQYNRYVLTTFVLLSRLLYTWLNSPFVTPGWATQYSFANRFLQRYIQPCSASLQRLSTYLAELLVVISLILASLPAFLCLFLSLLGVLIEVEAASLCSVVIVADLKLIPWVFALPFQEQQCWCGQWCQQ